MGHIKVPLSSRKAAMAALTLYAPCRSRAVWMHRSALVLLRLFGARALPTRSAVWEPPMIPVVWEEFCGQLERLVGPYDAFAVGERTQGERSGFALLLLERGSPRAFVKVRRGDAATLHREYEVIRQVYQAAPRTFAIPRGLGTGSTGEWSYIVTEPLPSNLHRVPRRPPLDEISAEISAALQELPRDSAPSHWEPMHGDFTPWNLRELPGAGLVLFDWEDTAWAPPGADAVLYRASAEAVGVRVQPGTVNAEAADFWMERIRGRSGANSRDQGLARSLLHNLAQMKGAGPPARIGAAAR